ncbi:hypothetical protein BH23GEM8_BH23GEM8_00110 [soil metagenome]
MVPRRILESIFVLIASTESKLQQESCHRDEAVTFRLEQARKPVPR